MPHRASSAQIEKSHIKRETRLAVLMERHRDVMLSIRKSPRPQMVPSDLLLQVLFDPKPSDFDATNSFDALAAASLGTRSFAASSVVALMSSCKTLLAAYSVDELWKSLAAQRFRGAAAYDAMCNLEAPADMSRPLTWLRAYNVISSCLHDESWRDQTQSPQLLAELPVKENLWDGEQSRSSGTPLGHGLLLLKLGKDGEGCEENHNADQQQLAIVDTARARAINTHGRKTFAALGDAVLTTYALPPSTTRVGGAVVEYDACADELLVDATSNEYMSLRLLSAHPSNLLQPVQATLDGTLTDLLYTLPHDADDTLPHDADSPSLMWHSMHLGSDVRCDAFYSRSSHLPSSCSLLYEHSGHLLLLTNSLPVLLCRSSAQAS